MQYHSSQVKKYTLGIEKYYIKTLKNPPLKQIEFHTFCHISFKTWSVVNTVALQEPVFSSKTSLPKTTTTSWRSGLGHSTALLWLDSLRAHWFHQSCWAPPTWPSSTSTVTIPRTGQGSRWTIKVRRCPVLICVSLLMIGSSRGRQPWGDTTGATSSKMSPEGMLRNETLVYSSW